MGQAALKATLKIEPETAAAIDRDHLSRMTFGERGLQRELLELFDRQATILLARLRDGAPAAMLAHTLKGSATGIGAWDVARAASALEGASSPAERGLALDSLSSAVDAVRAEITGLLAAA
jgi:hypothetical protein